MKFQRLNVINYRTGHNIVFLKMRLSHIAGRDSLIGNSVKRTVFGTLSPLLQKYKKRFALASRMH